MAGVVVSASLAFRDFPLCADPAPGKFRSLRRSVAAKTTRCQPSSQLPTGPVDNWREVCGQLGGTLFDNSAYLSSLVVTPPSQTYGLLAL